MTISEFKAWLDGFSAGIKDQPTKEQWEMVQEKLAGVHEPLPTLPEYPKYIEDYRYMDLTGYWPKVGELTC